MYLLARWSLFFRELSCFILLPRSRCSGVRETSQFWKELSCFFKTITRADGIENRLGLLLAYRIVINCTTAESVLELVSLYLASRYTHGVIANQIYIFIVIEKITWNLSSLCIRRIQTSKGRTTIGKNKNYDLQKRKEFSLIRQHLKTRMPPSFENIWGELCVWH